MRHRHADLIHAWAEGAEIEYLSKITGKWCSSGSDPLFSDGTEYRIKPEKKPDASLFYYVANRVVSEDAPCVSWSGVAKYSNLSLTFDGDTGKLKKAEVL